MTMNSDTSLQNNLAIKVQGDLGNLQITEESSDSEDDSFTLQGVPGNPTSPNSIANIPKDLVQPNTSPIFGSVAVTNSENVQFGNNTYFHGPVTIKQVIQPRSGIENASYIKTDDEDTPQQSQVENPSAKKFTIQLWHKLTFSIIGVIMIGGICALVLIMQNQIMPHNSNQDMSSKSSQDFSDVNTTSDHMESVWLCFKNYQVLIMSAMLIQVTFLLLYCSLLTKKIFYGDSDDIPVTVAKKSKVNNKGFFNGSKTYINDFKGDELLIAPGHLRIVSRTDWLAQPVANALDKLKQPVPWVIITHTATESCFIQSACVLSVRLMQTYHIESRGWYDIGYNFLVGGDGSAYYGRGWDYQGAHTKGYNKYSIAIAFIGTFNSESPPRQQVLACQKLIRLGVQEGKISKDYKLFAHRQLMSTLSPGDKVYEIIKTWPHFVKNYTDNLIPNY